MSSPILLDYEAGSLFFRFDFKRLICLGHCGMRQVSLVSGSSEAVTACKERQNSRPDLSLEGGSSPGAVGTGALPVAPS